MDICGGAGIVQTTHGLITVGTQQWERLVNITVLPEIDLVVVHKNNSMTTETSVDRYLKILRKVTSAKNFENDGFYK